MPQAKTNSDTIKEQAAIHRAVAEDMRKEREEWGPSAFPGQPESFVPVEHPNPEMEGDMYD